MAFTDYFLREMLAFRDLAKKEAERNPALMPFLGTPGRDPDVERLLEGAAFLFGRLREKIDDDLPEITHGLFNMLWPNYLRPLPAASVIQYEPTGNTTNSVAIPRGTLVESVPVDGVRCQFQTIYDVDLLPLRVVEQRMIERNGGAVVAVRFALTGGNLQSLRLSRLRVFLNGEGSIPHTLYLTLTHRLKEVRFVVKDGGHDGECRENVTAALPPSCVTPLGFHEDEGMLPYPKGMKLGYRILQEYFCYPEKFLFIQIADLERGLSRETRQRFQGATEFELHFVLDHLPEKHESFHAGNWNLSCTPVVNIFPFTAKARQFPKSTYGHKIVPDERRPNHYSVHSVERVETWLSQNKAGEGHAAEEAKNFTRYRLRIVSSMDGAHADTYIQMDDAARADQFFKLHLLCTNRDCPDQLQTGDIRMVAGSAEGAATPFTNILPLSRSIPFSCDSGILWKVLSNMSLTSIPLDDVPALRSVIATHAFRAAHDHGQSRLLKNHLDSIRAITSVETDRIFKGFPRRGARTTITMDQSRFSCQGAMYLFGAVLNEFLGMYATAESFHQLVVTEASRKEEYRWPARIGGIAG